MDALDKYKQAWDNQPEETTSISKVDIYKMAHSKSSSVVKWIFIIGLLEVLFWTGLNLIVPEKQVEILEAFHIAKFVKITTYLHYVVIALFLYLFYVNYTSISITDTTKNLMRKILKVRKTVTYYVYYNIGIMFIVSVISYVMMLSQPDLLFQAYDLPDFEANKSKYVIITLIVIVFIIVVLCVFMWLFYKVIYGILLRKLNRNYKELSKLEELGEA